MIRLALALLLLSLPIAEAAETHPARTLIPNGWQHVVISVRDEQAMARYFKDVLGWQVRARGKVPNNRLMAWGLPPQAKARAVVMGNPGAERGTVQIIRFKNVPQRRIRSHDQAWETGGIYNMNLRTTQMDALASATTNWGWMAPSDPVRFTFGPFIVQEWIPRHRDGVRIAFVQREAPPLEGWPNLKTTSRIFNSTQIVSDMERAKQFYEGVLGFQPYLENRSASPAPAEHVLGLSREAMSTVVRDVRIVNPTGENEGSIELLAFEDYSGRDFSQFAVPPNLGMLMLRFAVPDVAALADYLARAEVPFAMPLTAVTGVGGVKMRALAIRSPDGAWLEFYEPAGD